jgi:Uma2 family endonuclease
MQRAYLPHYTANDYAQWEGDWELLDGIPIAMSPAPVINHQYTNTQLSSYLNEQLRNCPNCMVIQEAEWRVHNDTVVRPDTVVICYPPQDYLTKRPELVIEVLSPSTARMDETTKLELYQTEGVPYYMIVDPKKLMAKVYQWHEGRYIKINDFINGRCPLKIGDCEFEFDFDLVFNRVRKAMH